MENLQNILLFLSEQQYLDISLYIFIGYFIVKGWKRGAIVQLYYLFSLLSAVALSFRYSAVIGNYISSWLNSNLQISEIFGGVIVFVATITIASYLNNILVNRVKKNDIGSKLLGSLVSILVSNLVLTLIFTSSSTLPLPNLIKNSLNDSKLVSFYTNPDGAPQQTLEVLIGTDLLKVVSRINELTGKSTVVVDEEGCLELPAYKLSDLKSEKDIEIEFYNLIALERESQDIDALELNQNLSEVALNYAFEMYTNGFWCHQNPLNGEKASDRVSSIGFPFKTVGENLAIASSIRSGHDSLMNSESHRNTILDNEYRRVGIGIVSGPLGLIIVQIFTS